MSPVQFRSASDHTWKSNAIARSSDSDSSYQRLANQSDTTISSSSWLCIRIAEHIDISSLCEQNNPPRSLSLGGLPPFLSISHPWEWIHGFLRLFEVVLWGRIGMHEWHDGYIAFFPLTGTILLSNYPFWTLWTPFTEQSSSWVTSSTTYCLSRQGNQIPNNLQPVGVDHSTSSYSNKTNQKLDYHHFYTFGKEFEIQPWINIEQRILISKSTSATNPSLRWWIKRTKMRGCKIKSVEMDDASFDFFHLVTHPSLNNLP